MTRRTSHTILALATGLALAAGTATAAQADAFRHDDATGDVVVSVHGSGSHVDPSQTQPDFRKLTVLHTRWVVSVATVLRDFDGYVSNWTATIVTSHGTRFELVRAGGGSRSRPYVTAKRNGTLFKCDGIHVSATSTGIIARVPTRCLGNPCRVRVGVLAHTNFGPYRRSDRGFDDVLRDGAVSFYDPTLSAWIAR